MTTIKHKLTLSPVTIILHWLVGLSILAMLVLGFYMTNTQTIPLFSWHKSFGVLLFILVLVRSIWRLKQGWIEPINPQKKRLNAVAKVSHWSLLVATIIMPISGMMLSGFAGYGVSVFGLKLIPSNISNLNPFKVEAFNQPLAQFAQTVHYVVGVALVVLIALHVLAALKHHLFDRDRTLLRMLAK